MTTVPAQVPVTVHEGDGATAAFAIGFLLPAPGHLVVRVSGAAVVLGVDFSIVGGNVVFAAPPAAAARIVLRRATPVRQLTEFPTQPTMVPKAVEAALNERALVDQELKAHVERAVAAPPGEAGVELPGAEARRARAAVWAGDAAAGLTALALAPGELLGADAATGALVGVPGRVQVDVAPSVVSSRWAAGAAAWGAGVSALQVQGWLAPGDGGAALWARVSAEPGHGGKFRSQDRYLPGGGEDADDGGWWEVRAVNAAVPAAALGVLPGVGDVGAAIQAALDLTAATGVELLWAGGAYETSLPLTGGAARMAALGQVTLTYTGGAHAQRLVHLTPGGAGDVSLIGRWVFDAADKANVALAIHNNADTRINVTLGDVTGRRARMVTGGPSHGAGGLQVTGAVDWLRFERLAAEAVTREAGTGSAGVYGCMGVEIARTSWTRAPRRVAGRVIEVDGVTTEDTPGDPACADCDGAAVFQNDEDGALCLIDQVACRNAMGRALKGQVFRSGHIGHVSVRRSIAGITGGAAEVALQYGEGSVGSIDVRYDGAAATVHGQGTTIVTGYTSLSRADGYGALILRDITIRDLTTGDGDAPRIRRVLQAIQASGGDGPMFASLENVILHGRGPRNLMDIGGTGGSWSGAPPLYVRIAGVRGEITESLIRATDYPNRMEGHVSAVWNTGEAVPTVALENGSPLGAEFGRLFDGGANVGVLRLSRPAGPPGLVGPNASYLSPTTAYAIADVVLFAGFVSAGAEVELPPYGLQPGQGRLTVAIPAYGPPGVLKTTSGSDSISTVEAVTGLTVGSGGVDPGGLDLTIWKAGDLLNVKNHSGEGRYLLVRSEG